MINNLTNLTPEHKVPDFKLPEPYCNDVWPIKSWDYYKNSDEKSIAVWNVNGNTYTDSIDFAICNNIYIREEIKFYMYNLIEINKVNLYSLTTYWKRVKSLIRYVNDYLMDNLSLTELESSDGFKDFIHNKDKRKKQTTIGSGININADMKKVPNIAKSPYIRVLDRIILLVNDYYDDRPLFKKDSWDVSKLPVDVTETNDIQSLHFESIPQPQIKETIKSYAWKRLNTVSLNTIHLDIIYLATFSNWLYESHPEIDVLSMLDRNVIEEYIEFCRVKAAISSGTLFKRLSSLSTFLDFSRMYKISNTPKKVLLDNSDYHVKVKYERTPYSDYEMRQIVENLKYLSNHQHARMFFCLIEIGCRISELCTLKPNALKKKKTSYSLMIDARKNSSLYTIPISDVAGQILEKAISVSRELFGTDVKYIFASSKNSFIRKAVLDEQMKKVCLEHNILDDSGKILHVTFHRFRTTKVSKYLQKGLDADIVSLLVGHRVKSTLKHYAKATNKELKEALQPLMDKYTLLIENAGNISAIKDLSTDSIPLPNGRCNKAADTGICEHANHCLSCAMFVPQKEYLYAYEKELSDVETAIAVAEANNNQRLLEYNQQLKEQLEVIIQKCRGETNEI